MSPDLNANFESSLSLVEVPTDAYLEDSSLASEAVDRLTSVLGWSREGKGPFGELIQPGSRVLIKPNFVLDHNQGTGGMDPMVTHQSVVKAVAEAALQAE